MNRSTSASPTKPSASPNPRKVMSAAADQVSGKSVSVVIALSLFAAWMAAGSGGLLAHSLRHAITWCAMVGIVLAAFQLRDWRTSNRILTLLVLFAGIILSGLSTPVIGVFCVAALVGSLLAEARLAHLRPLAFGLALFGLYRFAAVSIPSAWLFADWVGSLFGSLAGFIVREPLNVGATFGGIDLLVLSLCFLFAWVWQTRAGRLTRLSICAAGILVSHLAYLCLIALSPTLLKAFESTGLKDFSIDTIPWNLPIVGVLLLTGTTTMLSRWFEQNLAVSSPRSIWTYATPALAFLLPIVSILSPTPLDLHGKKIVLYEKGFLNWLRPQHGEGYGRLSIGMYGMMHQFLEMHGANSVISKDLSDADLQNADALVLIYPDKPWESGQLDRIHAYVKNGGTLLVMGEHTIHGKDDDEMRDRKPYWPGEAQARFNDAIIDSSIRVNFDSATFAVGGWLQSYEAIAHPITAGVGDTRNEFGSVIGASLHVRFPAKPILIGRYGWNDPGDEGSSAAMMGNHKYDGGDHLGDIVLAAEDNVGKGRVIVFGDTSAITNGINVSCHDFNARLFSYITNASLGPQSIARQLIGLLISGGLIVGLLRTTSSTTTLATMAAITTSSLLCTSITHANATLLPDGRFTSPNRLAYIDQSHLETASQESWRDDGTMGVAMCLMRDGYVALTMSEFSKERLDRAAVLISVAPNRPFSASERSALEQWISNGGIFILTVGWPERAGSLSLMNDLGFAFGKDPDHPATADDPPEPQGFFKSPYIEANGYRAHVRFHAAWPIVAIKPAADLQAEDARSIAYGAGTSSIILRRNIGKGKVVVVGDTNFATNQNLEREGGEAFDGMHENNDFWRWLIADLTGEKPWIPAALATQPTGGAE